MNFGSLFTGIGGFDRGLEQAGMTCMWQNDIDAYCLQELNRLWPDVPKYGDVRDVGRHNLESVDLICGGFPCQDISVAGKRAGLAGKRSGLWFEFYRVLEELRPPWTIIENVRGLLSSNKGRDLAVILRGLEKLGYHVAGRVLDAQYFGVAQRRRRLFLVGSLGTYSCIEILFEPESLSWDSPPSRQKGTVAPAIPANGDGTNRTGNERTETEMIVVAPLRSRQSSPGVSLPGRGGEDDENLVVAHSLTSHNQRWDLSTETFVWDNAQCDLNAEEANVSYALNPQANQGVGVRRLTPLEYERLQGFPDGWTEGFSDSRRYRMVGNAVVPAVAQWIGERIIEHDKIMRSRERGNDGQS